MLNLNSSTSIQWTPVLRRLKKKVDHLLTQPASLKCDQAFLPSPCQSVCVMNSETSFCQGCLRQIDEIANWSTLDEAGKLEIWRSIQQRLSQVSE
jgi:hypothetical protein